MNLSTVMEELGAAVGTVAGLRVYPWAASKISPPGVIFGLPDEIRPNEAYGRGKMRVPDLPLILLVGRASNRTELATLAAYCAGSGSKSLVAALQGYGGFTQIEAITITRIELDAVKLAGIDYLGAIFHLDLIGSGTN